MTKPVITGLSEMTMTRKPVITGLSEMFNYTCFIPGLLGVVALFLIRRNSRALVGQ